MPDHNTESAIPSCDIDQLVAERDAVVERAEHVERLGAELEQLGARRPACGGWNGRGSWSAAEEVKEWESRAWQRLLTDSGLRDFMDATARAQWEEQYRSRQFPPFTREAIAQAFDQIHAQRGDMVARGVRELFARLSSQHKTNKANAFGGKIIIGAVCSKWAGNYHEIYSSGRGNVDLIDDLNRTLHVVRGVPAPSGRAQSASGILGRAVSENRQNELIDFPFFTVRLYFGPGTAHIRFKHDEDVRRINAMLSIATGGTHVPNSRRTA
jgi:hypothetical protein